MKPKAILTSDVHFNLQTLELASKALQMAVNKANELEVPLIIAGDLHDTKANIRGECINTLRATLRTLSADKQCFILRGNHDAIHEKSAEHSLSFLEDLATIVSRPNFYNELSAFNGKSIWLFPYQHDAKQMEKDLKKVDPNSLIIMHQGIVGSNMGDYVQDKSAIPQDWIKDFRVISGHYHTRQDIKTGRPRKGGVGLASYIGNPFTLGYGESKDPEKGFQILMSDGTLEFVPTNLRKHIVYEIEWNKVWPKLETKPGDLVLVKLTGTREELSKISKASLGAQLGLIDYRLDLIPLDVKSSKPKQKKQSQHEILDSLIDTASNVSDDQKTRVKKLWRGL
jgi:DNA repair exonuclease SbcCD nuclease subunit